MAFKKSFLEQDVLPGKYNLQDMVSFVDLPTLKPKFIEMKNVAWVSGEDRMAGKIIFPSDFDETLDVEFATNELVSMLFIFFIYCKLCSNKKS